ncbi:DNA repair protein Rad60 [Schizosaccharomyces japonicus yFS275]|uniref:DNA repair protein Rad60 n=1 Tax=Schizosaccharomyces japonicus (strain yFS275 / FY16936) TaxID=402676 RepID=B6JXN7_SCHJY|nr:DNA repair protein Rad60 [Schizosaccharomyces japonicus yFS275]EEB05181.1 DNA repair protein Rad60 [Schizosaccharomyces japonicus yFS275]
MSLEEDDDVAFFTKPIKKPALSFHALSDLSGSDTLDDEDDDDDVDFFRSGSRHRLRKAKTDPKGSGEKEVLKRKGTFKDGPKEKSPTGAIKTVQSSAARVETGTAASTSIVIDESDEDEDQALDSKEVEEIVHIDEQKPSSPYGPSLAATTAAAPTTTSLVSFLTEEDEEFERRLLEVERHVEEFQQTAVAGTGLGTVGTEGAIPAPNSESLQTSRESSIGLAAPATSFATSLTNGNDTSVVSSISSIDGSSATPAVLLQLAVIGQRVAESKTDLPKDWDKPLIFKIKSNQEFRRLKLVYCQRKNIPEVVLTFQGKRLWDFGTPKGAGMLKVDTRLVIHAYEVNDYKLVCTNRILQDTKLLHSDHSDSEDDGEPAKLLHLLLRSKSNPDIRISMPPNVTVDTLIKEYCKQANIPYKTSIRLEFEGDWLDPKDNIQDLDLEDDDQLNVIL